MSYTLLFPSLFFIVWQNVNYLNTLIIAKDSCLLTLLHLFIINAVTNFISHYMASPSSTSPSASQFTHHYDSPTSSPSHSTPTPLPS